MIQNNFRLTERSTPHTIYGGTMEFDWNTGILMLPVAAPGNPYGDSNPRQPAKIVQTHAPYGFLTVRWTAERVGAKPLCPDPRPPSNSPLVLLKATVTTTPPTLEPDGLVRRFRAAGVYVFGMTSPVWVKDGLPMGCLPNDLAGPTSFFLSPEDFSPDILPLGNGFFGRVT